jgi:hypothetical protein
MTAGVKGGTARPEGKRAAASNGTRPSTARASSYISAQSASS